LYFLKISSLEIKIKLPEILKINWIWNNKYWHQKIQLAFIFLLAIEIVHSGIDRFHIVPPISFVPSAVLCVRSLWGKGVGCGSSNRWLLVSSDGRKDGSLLPDITIRLSRFCLVSGPLKETDLIIPCWPSLDSIPGAWKSWYKNSNTRKSYNVIFSKPTVIHDMIWYIY